ncbi:Phosphatidylglycerol/phosphatidylinositol transfer protein [Mycoemilia scoparia]|uniref:Phosphatidylglycerol/phosphatidylinositol transfer protein n=1 Tax=Mycoemilia scoparia TaxID=417184 RepID=A0A9W8DXC3_9FUNG|nr:Phosphatidylglycerol/phosphatidylinositol transfer protein [Mycoemilia scoparia]
MYEFSLPSVPKATVLFIALLFCQWTLANPFAGFNYQQVGQTWRSWNAKLGLLSHAADDGDDGRPINDIITDFSDKDDLAKIKYIDIDPEQPKRGIQVKIDALAFIKEKIEGATAHIRVKYGILPIYSKTYDLCKELEMGLNKTCPVDAGDLTVHIEAQIPSFIFPGWYTLEATGQRTSDDKQIGKIVAHVKF